MIRMRNYSDHIPDYCSKVLSAFECAGQECYVVGGAVRDIVMGRVPSDFDLTTSAMPEETIGILEENGIKFFPTGLKHGTVTAVVSGNNIEITTFRVDGTYSDNRRPDSVGFTRNIEEDVKRRDYTINAMYLDKDGNLIDLTGGLDDIASRVIRAVGDSSLRYKEDALRILRGLRFAAVTGFAIEQNTYDSMVSLAHLVANVSRERVAAELNGLVTAPDAPAVIRSSVPVLAHVIPELGTCQDELLEHNLNVLTRLRCGEDGRRDLCLSLAALLHGICNVEVLLTELKYSNAVKEEVCTLVSYCDHPAEPGRSSVHRLMCDPGTSLLRKLIVLWEASDIDCTGIEDTICKLEDEGAALSVSELKINGGDVIGAGVPAGPEVGEVLGRIFDEYIEGKIPNDREKLLERLQNL